MWNRICKQYAEYASGNLTPWMKPLNRISRDILSISWDIRKPHFSLSYISVYTSMGETCDTQVGHSLWIFYRVWTCAQAPPMTVHRMVESEMKKQCEEKNSGNSVHKHIYCHVLSISKHIHLIFVYQFCHAFKFLSIVYKCTDISPKHSTLYFAAKIEKKICADHEYLQPLILLIHTTRTYSYILVHTRTYSYILSYNNMYLESGWSRLAMTYCLFRVCRTLVQCITHSILPFWGLFDGQASQAGLATPKVPQPRVDLIDIAAPPSIRCSRVGTAKPGSLNPCTCRTCEGLLESSYQPEIMG